MKKLIFIICLLFTISAGALEVVNNSMLVTSAAPDYLFKWTCESTTADYAVTGADNIATAVSSAAIDAALYNEGTHSIDIPTASDRYTFDWANDTAKLESGTITFDLYITSIGNGATAFRCRASSSNYVTIQFSTTTNNHLILYHNGNTTTRTVSSAVALSNDTWYKVTAKWSVAGVGGNYLSLQIDSNAADVGTTALGTPNETTGTLDFGEANGVTTDFYRSSNGRWVTLDRAYQLLPPGGTANK